MATHKTPEFDPVKKVDDLKSQSVIWSTVSLNAAVEAVKKGLPLKVNPFRDNDIQLLKPDLVFRRTEEEIEDWIHCKQDKVYFGNKCYLKTPQGVQRVTMRNYQEDYLHLCEEENMTILLAARQSGKSVSSGIDMLHELLFDVDKAALIVSKSGQAGIDLLNKVKDMYRFLPWHLKAGINVWNQHRVSFDNNSTVWVEAPSPTAGVSSTVNYLLLDEFAWLPMSGPEIDLYLDNILPTVSQDENAKVRIMSTQNGHNKFYKLWDASVKGESEYAHMKIDWWQVPQLNKKTGKWEKRTEEWKNKMIRKMGSPESFYYMYGTVFLSSDKCLVSRERISALHNREELFINHPEINEMLLASEKCKRSLYFRKDITIETLKKDYFCVLVDLAEGGGGDSTVYHFFKLEIDQNADVSFDEIGYYKTNEAELLEAANDFWILMPQLFSTDHYVVSVELNTYGILWETYLMQLNEPEFKVEWSWRFRIAQEFDYFALVGYKKGSQEDELPGMNKLSSNAKFIPGIRWNSANKPVACVLLKSMVEKDIVRIYDIRTISELENFEDKTGHGHYKASYGHDDIIMTCVQIPQMIETPKFKEFIYEMKEQLAMENAPVVSSTEFMMAPPPYMTDYSQMQPVGTAMPGVM